jgi:valyl-tRNA synthetase
MDTVVYVPIVYKSQAEADAEATALSQTSVTVATEEPADLSTALDRLDVELEKLDNLAAKEQEFPNTIANIDGKLKELEAQDLDALQSLEARSAQVGKLSNMRLLAAAQAKKTRAKVTEQQEAVIKIGARAGGFLEQRWWANYTRLADEIRVKFEHQPKINFALVRASSRRPTNPSPP